MTIGNTIRKLRKEKGLTLNQLATLIESDVGNLSRLERDQQGYTDSTINKIAAALGVPVPALFTEDDAQRAAMLQFSWVPLKIVDREDPSLVHIPKVKLRLSAGISGFEVDPERFDGSTTTVPADWIERKGFNRDNLIAIRVRGESMEPTLYEDDLVVINTADKKPEDGGIFAINYEGEPIVKRLSRDAGRWWLTSDNPDQRKFHRKVCDGDGCIVIGRIVRRESERF